MLERMPYGLPRAARGVDWEELYTISGIGRTARRVLSLELPVTLEKDKVIWDTSALCVIYRGVLRSSVASEVHPFYVPDA